MPRDIHPEARITDYRNGSGMQSFFVTLATLSRRELVNSHSLGAVSQIASFSPVVEWRAKNSIDGP